MMEEHDVFVDVCTIDENSENLAPKTSQQSENLSTTISSVAGNKKENDETSSSISTK
jgi:hypothetical protein